jgi:pimeloyl-ACP methyl ester carboxylesterase
MAMTVPARVERLAVLSVGHPAAFFTEGVRQRERSWYMLFFQFPGVAEEALPRDDWALWRTVFGERGDHARYQADLSRPGALTAALNWYRANIQPETFGRTTAPPLPPVGCPVLGIWSDGDDYLGEAQMTASEQHVAGPWQYRRISGASHWIPLDAPDEVGRLLVDFAAGD